MIQKSSIVLGLILLSTILGLTSCQKEEIEVTPQEELPKDGPLFNQRYCEVLLTKLETSTGITLEAYNTVGCSTCPEEEWTALDIDTLQEEFGSPYIRLNGPRHWVLDSIYSNTTMTNCDQSFGGLEMSLVATIPIELEDLTTEISYVVNSVARNTEWHYFKGKQVYVLEDPSGKCFIMQSYSQKIDTNLQLEELESLESRLNLPAGWSYKAIVLENDLVVASQDGFADLVSDELENAYQYLNDGCL